jgi:NAD(P)-dependent dehydrogenase (short-subunit alcohol dehydrogenase family)
MTRQVWLVTGASTGFGLATVKELLKQGYKVAATTRSLSRLTANVGPADASQVLPLEVDVTSDEAIKKSIDDTIAKFGGLDVLLNNAGYGLQGGLEEITREELVTQLNVNVVAVHSYIKYTFPHFRSRRNGYYLTIGSIGGNVATAGWGVYGATKAGVQLITEVAALEGAEYGIKATTVCPGPFETNFVAAVTQPATKLPIYEPIREGWAKFSAGGFPGDAGLAAELFIELANNPNPPKVIFIGGPAVEDAERRTQEMLKEIRDWRVRAVATDKK